MAYTNFDAYLKDVGQDMPSDLRDASIFVHDTLDVAAHIAAAIFGKNTVTPFHILAVYDRILSKESQADSTLDSVKRFKRSKTD